MSSRSRSRTATKKSSNKSSPSPSRSRSASRSKGKTERELEEEIWVKSPESGRWIIKGGDTYQRLMNDPRYKAKMSNLEERKEGKLSSKKGQSNAGKYTAKDGPFCGPNNTYPVGTPGRARAALAYARYAQDPKKVRDCVHKVAEERGYFKKSSSKKSTLSTATSKKEKSSTTTKKPKNKSARKYGSVSKKETSVASKKPVVKKTSTVSPKKPKVKKTSTRKPVVKRIGKK